MNYFQLIAKIKNINNTQITNSFSFDALFRITSYYVTPLFIYLKFTPNLVTYLSLSIGIFGAMILYIFGYEYVKWSILLFFIHIIIDYCDGNTARFHGTSTFFGRFIDGLFNILVVSLFQISMVLVLISNVHIENSILTNYVSYNTIILISLLSIALYPVQHFIYDRYSSHIRWINEEYGTKLYPSIKQLISFRIIHFLDNIHYLSLLLIIYFVDLIFINLLVNLILSTILIPLHIYYSSIYMQVDANKNHRVKKVD